MQFDDPRSILEAAAASPSTEVDPRALIRRGTAMRRARFAAAAAGLAVVVAGASASFGLLGRDGGDGHRPAAADCSREEQTVSVFLEPYATDAAVEELRRELEETPGVGGVEYVSDREAVEEAAAVGGELGPLPPRFLVETSGSAARAGVLRTESPVVSDVIPGGRLACIVRRFCDGPPSLAMSIFLRDDATRTQTRGLVEDLAADEGVATVEFVSKREAFREFRELYDDQRELWSSVRPRDLPASIRLVAVDADALERLAGATSPAIEAVRHASGIRLRLCAPEPEESTRCGETRALTAKVRELRRRLEHRVDRLRGTERSLVSRKDGPGAPSRDVKAVRRAMEAAEAKLRELVAREADIAERLGSGAGAGQRVPSPEPGGFDSCRGSSPR